jgi:pSer/pThr/pTyr-binding forkhead associated (FHA) protein
MSNPFRLKVVQGKPNGEFLNFPQGEFVFGRGPECHIRPNSELVSRQHCLLRVGNGAALLRDLGSTNGTLVNGRRVTSERILLDGDTLQLGPLVLQVVLEPEAVDMTCHGNTPLCDTAMMGPVDNIPNSTSEFRLPSDET